jgi:glucose-6-phosphate 1-epimerase
MAFEVHNTGPAAWPFALALHTYLRTDDIARTQLRGLEGLRYWDAVQHLAQPDVRLTQPEGPLTFSAETDRVYADAQAPLTVQHPGGAVRLTQSASLPDVVVWNPAAERCATLNDMPPGGWRDMLCVEAARINAPVRLSPGQSWSGWQQLCVLPGP